MNSYKKHTCDNSSKFQFAFSQNVSKPSYKVLAVSPRYVRLCLHIHESSCNSLRNSYWLVFIFRTALEEQ